MPNQHRRIRNPHQRNRLTREYFRTPSLSRAAFSDSSLVVCFFLFILCKSLRVSGVWSTVRRVPITEPFPYRLAIHVRPRDDLFLPSPPPACARWSAPFRLVFSPRLMRSVSPSSLACRRAALPLPFLVFREPLFFHCFQYVFPEEVFAGPVFSDPFL